MAREAVADEKRRPTERGIENLWIELQRALGARYVLAPHVGSFGSAGHFRSCSYSEHNRTAKLRKRSVVCHAFAAGDVLGECPRSTGPRKHATQQRLSELCVLIYSCLHGCFDRSTSASAIAASGATRRCSPQGAARWKSRASGPYAG